MSACRVSLNVASGEIIYLGRFSLKIESGKELYDFILAISGPFSYK